MRRLRGCHVDIDAGAGSNNVHSSAVGRKKSCSEDPKTLMRIFEVSWAFMHMVGLNRFVSLSLLLWKGGRCRKTSS
jgi:hypothetical protein